MSIHKNSENNNRASSLTLTTIFTEISTSIPQPIIQVFSDFTVTTVFSLQINNFIELFGVSFQIFGGFLAFVGSEIQLKELRVFFLGEALLLLHYTPYYLLVWVTVLHIGW